MKTIITHNGTFHADEITAIALLKVFRPALYKVKRLPHQSAIPTDADYVIDIGREYDGKTRFDHHQWEGGKSSAGLIWDYINTPDYPNISELVKAIDENDVGIRKATNIEYSRIIGSFNLDDNQSKYQEAQFNKAVTFAEQLIMNLKRAQESLNESKDICSSAPNWQKDKTILHLPKWIPGWQTFINGNTKPDIEAVVWYDDTLDTWNIQTTSKSTDSYEKVGRSLYPSDKMEFVHANKFFAVASSKEILEDYINNCFK